MFRNMGLRLKIILGSCVTLVLMVILGIVSINSNKQLAESNNWVDHTHTVIGTANAIVAAGVDMETGMRDYLLAGKEAFLYPYNGGMDDSVCKPFDTKAILDVLQRWLSHTGTVSQVSGSQDTKVLRKTVIDSFDYNALDNFKGLQMEGSSTSLLVKVIGGFLSDTPGQLQILEQALQDNDPAAVMVLGLHVYRIDYSTS